MELSLPGYWEPIRTKYPEIYFDQLGGTDLTLPTIQSVYNFLCLSRVNYQVPLDTVHQSFIVWNLIHNSPPLNSFTTRKRRLPFTDGSGPECKKCRNL